MKDLVAFALAALVLLITPGPTNTLLATSGAVVGLFRSLSLIAAEVGGYLVSISVFLLLLSQETGGSPLADAALKGSAALWLVFSAVKLWRNSAEGLCSASAPVGFWRVFVTTLLNPKAFILALVIIPSLAPAAGGAWVVALSVLIALAGLFWISLGAFLSVSSRGLTPRLILRAAAVVLVIYASALAGSAVAAVL